LIDRPTADGRVAHGDHTGQFVLSEDLLLLPAGWTRHTLAGWWLATNELPVLAVVDRSGRPRGWAVGHVIDDGVLSSGPIRLDTDERRRMDWAAIDALYERLAGRFLLVLLPEDEPTVMLDAYGSLAAVHSESQRTVASVPTLLGGDVDRGLAEATGFPSRCTWLPFGLTLTLGVRRLAADHSLDLRTWRTQRRWIPPVPEAGVDTEEAAEEILTGLRRTMDAVARAHPLTLSLTGGRDSRVLLAAARESLDDTSFFTFGAGTVDEHLARRLAARFRLRHTVLVTEETASDRLDGWLAVTGHAVGGELWRVHESLRLLDPRRVLLPGTAGEVGRAHTYRPGDPEEGPVTAETLLQRLRLPALTPFLDGASAWLAALPELPFSTTLELGYIEQRLSCWAGPGHYGNRTSLFELSPYASRPLFRRMLSLPLEYRRREQLASDIFRIAWPELTALPFNRFSGLPGSARALRSATCRLGRLLPLRPAAGHAADPRR
jgi:hypothetical protein